MVKIFMITLSISQDENNKLEGSIYSEWIVDNSMSDYSKYLHK